MPQPKLRSTSPFVGLGGTHNTVRVERRHDRVICGLSPWAYALALAVLLFCGPALLALLWFRPPGTIDLAKQPVILAMAILFIPLVCCVLLVRYLFTQHRFEILPGSGVIRFFKRAGSRAAFEISLSSIERLEVEEEWYRPSRGRPIKNYVLVAHCQDGTRIDLCISASKQLIDSITNDIEKWMPSPP